jgi:hypothetical protein
MSNTTTASKGTLEIIDVGEERSIATVPMESMRFLPRVGERVFLPAKKLGEWELCDVMMVEYFLDGCIAGSEVESSGVGKITLYVRQLSKSVDRSIKKPSAA